MKPNQSDHALTASDQQGAGYQLVRFNAMKHGILSRYTVLSHENHADYESLVNSLMDEHLPAGATEQHLIEELASVIWRKRRVLQSEGATINKGLKESARNAKSVIPTAAPFEMGLSGEGTDLRDVMSLSDDEAATSQRDASADVQACYRAAKLLRTGGATAYTKAVRALHPESRDMWEDSVADGENSPSAEGLAAFIQQHLEPVAHQMEKEARHHQAIVNQTWAKGCKRGNWKNCPATKPTLTASLSARWACWSSSRTSELAAGA
jgi:hypothetical protein